MPTFIGPGAKKLTRLLNKPLGETGLEAMRKESHWIRAMAEINWRKTPRRVAFGPSTAEGG